MSMRTRGKGVLLRPEQDRIRARSDYRCPPVRVRISLSYIGPGCRPASFPELLQSRPGGPRILWRRAVNAATFGGMEPILNRSSTHNLTGARVARRAHLLKALVTAGLGVT